MPARILDGAAVAREIKAELQPRVEAFAARRGRPPGLGIVLVGDDAASETYVRNKLKSAGETGLRADLERLPAAASLDEVLGVVRAPQRERVHDGILVQSPLPAGNGSDGRAGRCSTRSIRRRTSTASTRPTSAASCRIGRRSCRARRSGSSSCSNGRRCGLPGPRRRDRPERHRRQADGDCCCCTGTRPSPSATRGRVDLPAVARRPTSSSPPSGGPAFVTPDFVKPGATVVDVGINRVDGPRRWPRRSSARKFRGWADFDGGAPSSSATCTPPSAEVAGALTPVPGGIGPLTIALAARQHARGRGGAGLGLAAVSRFRACFA